MDDAIFLLALVGIPVVVGAIVGYVRRPWWWAAAAAVVVFLVAVIAPAPEEGESRAAAGDIVFLLIASAIVAGLAWAGTWLGRRLAGRRAEAG